MLSLDSPRWGSFHTYFGSPDEVPQRLIAWRASIGSPDEELCWSELSDQFLHQGTITDAAYAAVPLVVRELGRVELSRRFDYMVRLGLIESARQTDSQAPTLPADFALEYHAAIADAGRLAAGLLALEWPKLEFRYLLSAIASLYGHGIMGNLLFRLDGLSGDCPGCGKCIYPDEVYQSGYVA
jgi:hypothetical protein